MSDEEKIEKELTGVAKFAVDCYNDLWEQGIAGSYVFLNDKGQVEVKRLTPDDCRDVLHLHDKIPDNITIVKLPDNEKYV